MADQGLLDDPTNFYQNTATPDRAQTATYDAQQRDVGSNETVQGQLTGLLDSDSPYLQRARFRGEAQAASRGLQNSSIAAGASEASAIDASLPIAQQDAQTYAQQGLTNQQAVNQSRSENANAQNTNNRFNTDFENQRYFREQDAANRLRVDEAAFQNQSALSGQQFNQQTQLNSQQNQATMDLSQQEFGQQTSLNQQQNDAAIALQAQQDAATQLRLEIQQQNENLRQQLDNQLKLQLQQNDQQFNQWSKQLESQLQQMNVSQQDRTAFAGYLRDTNQQYQVQQTKIALDPGLGVDEKNRALENLAANQRSNIQMMADLYGVDISWSNTNEPLITGQLGDIPGQTTTTPPIGGGGVTTPGGSTGQFDENGDPIPPTQTGGGTTTGGTTPTNGTYAAPVGGSWTQAAGSGSNPVNSFYTPSAEQLGRFTFGSAGTINIDPNNYMSQSTATRGLEPFPQQGLSRSQQENSSIYFTDANGTIRAPTPADIGQQMTPPQQGTPQFEAWLNSPASKYWRMQNAQQTQQLGGVVPTMADFNSLEQAVLFNPGQVTNTIVERQLPGNAT